MKASATGSVVGLQIPNSLCCERTLIAFGMRSINVRNTRADPVGWRALAATVPALSSV